MVTLNFTGGLPNESLEINDLVYYISNPNTNIDGSGFMTGDDDSGVSTYILIGNLSSIQIGADGNSFTLYVEEPDSGIIPPLQNDFIFFAKENIVELPEVKGYYSKVVFKNDSPFHAEMFASSMTISESSK